MSGDADVDEVVEAESVIRCFPFREEYADRLFLSWRIGGERRESGAKSVCRSFSSSFSMAIESI